MADYSTTWYSKSYALGKANKSIPLRSKQAQTSTVIYRLPAEQIAKFGQPDRHRDARKARGSVRWGPVAPRISNSLARMPLSRVLSRMCWLPAREMPLAGQFFHQRRGIASTFAQDINRGQR